MRPYAAGEGGDIDVFVNPYTGQVLGSRTHEDGLGRRHLMNFVYGLHMDLHLGGAMVWFLGLVSLLWVIDHVVAAILSFPSLKKWTASFRVRFRGGGYKRTFDLHRAGGLWLMPITLILAVSGLYFNWYDGFVRTVDAISPTTPRAIFTVPALETPIHDPQVSFGQAMDVVNSVGDQSRIDLMAYNPAKGVYELRLYDPRDIDTYGRRLMVVDGRGGHLISDRHVTEGGAGDVFLAWQYPLHSGKAFGAFGRAVIFVSGLVLTCICVTGLLIWWRKRKARVRAPI
ncbi:hypothetical protein GCM10011273_26850 [Asticcacaulis endophyticus]|uniref:PepSY-associated TM region n=1 Tax=Asticcacaulis endophyticus TaxID=1395890 RepID=A0A918QAI7_9CAUL|nr:hypothetical protein GCM10011273_26850 [Asticcacaulis endophyticus]